MTSAGPSSAIKEITRFVDRVVLPIVVLGIAIALVVKACSPSPQQHPQQKNMKHSQPNTDCQFNHQIPVHLRLPVSEGRSESPGTALMFSTNTRHDRHVPSITLQNPLAAFPGAA